MCDSGTALVDDKTLHLLALASKRQFREHEIVEVHEFVAFMGSVCCLHHDRVAQIQERSALRKALLGDHVVGGP